ncbi:recombination protein RecT [Zooshikella ganghwensis]|uniref:recombination protein RecT n=1 Tax=Zooshikella ganghwensis TaxID=202772 RepID=UPI000402284E|nr:recombination protein RecT [Zooshikella ganghwensis]
MSRSQQIAQAISQPAPPASTKKPMPTSIDGMLKDKRFLNQLQAALPKHMTPERMARIALTEIRKNNTLGQCDPLSLFGAIVQSAQLGLEIGSGLGHAYIIPFRNKRAQRVEVQFIVGYRGMIDLARRSGQIISLQAHAVYEGDDFDFAYGLAERLHHIPTSDVYNRGEMIGVYALAKLRDGGHQMEVMWKAEVDQIRNQSKAADSGPWKTHYEEMAKKTVIRRLFKYLPVSVEMQRAVTLEEQAQIGESQDHPLVFDTSNVFDGEYQSETEHSKEILNTTTGEVTKD